MCSYRISDDRMKCKTPSCVLILSYAAKQKNIYYALLYVCSTLLILFL